MVADYLRLAEAMARGEVPPAELARLEESLRSLTHAAELSTADAARLVAALAAARDAGATWLEQVAVPELESLARSRRGLAAYRQRGRPA